jgi:predicted nucleic acid-binding protein
VKRYVVEPDREEALRLLAADTSWVTAALRHARLAFAEDWRRLAVVQLDATTCRIAAELSELTRARSSEALHLAAAQRVGAPATAC